MFVIVFRRYLASSQQNESHSSVEHPELIEWSIPAKTKNRTERDLKSVFILAELHLLKTKKDMVYGILEAMRSLKCCFVRFQESRTVRDTTLTASCLV